MQGQKPPSNPVKLVPLEPAKPAVQLQPMSQPPAKKTKKKRKKKDKLTRIEKYNVAELCWTYYLNLSREPEDIAELLNGHLAKKRGAMLRAGRIHDSFQFPTLTKMDVRLFLEAQQKRIDAYLGTERKRMMEASFDVIQKVQNLAADTEESMGVWKARFEDALNRGDDNALIKASHMLRQEREQLHKMIGKLAELLGKVKTYISIDMMQAQVVSILDVIESQDDIDDHAKLHLMRQVGTTLDVNAIKVH